MNALLAVALLAGSVVVRHIPAADPAIALDPAEIAANYEAPNPQVSSVDDIFIAPENVIVTIVTADRRLRVEQRAEGIRYTVLSRDGKKTLYDALPFAELLAWEPKLAALVDASHASAPIWAGD